MAVLLRKKCECCVFRLFLIRMMSSTPSVNVLNLDLLPVLLLVLLCMLSVLWPQLRPLLVSSQTWRPSSALPCSLFLGSGKLTGRQEVYVLPDGDSHLVFLQDSLSGRRFLVNTVDSISVFPRLLRLCQLQLCQLHSPRPSSSPPVVLRCLVLVHIPFLYVLVLITSPGPSSWLLSLFPFLASIFSDTMPC